MTTRCRSGSPRRGDASSSPAPPTPSDPGASSTSRAPPTRCSRPSRGPGGTTAGPPLPDDPDRVRWSEGVESDALPEVEGLEDIEAGEAAATERWTRFRDDHLSDYASERDRPDLDTTSRLSAPLKYGEIHPRTILADIAAHGSGRTKAAETFVTELAWREFYADVLWHRPESAWADLRDELSALEYDDDAQAHERVEAWREGRTGYPIVDAGMRQLLAEGFMHNRLRMITASFLTKDLHVWWPVGARHFLDHLIDGDLASNNHGWQWVAGTGTDAAPYFRVFNPVTQGKKFDPTGDYVRRWVPELAHLEGAAAHEPWKHDDGLRPRLSRADRRPRPWSARRPWRGTSLRDGEQSVRLEP